MDKETARYIVTHFSTLLTIEEKVAMKHTRSFFEMENSDYTSIEELTKWYKKVGWLTEGESVLDFFKDGYDSFELRTAQRILSKYPNEVFLNYCPQCNKLTRTPLSKQCRHCGCDWHEQND